MGRGWQPRGRDALAAVRKRSRRDRGFSPGLFPGPSYVQVRSFIKLFADTAIAYNFDLTMTENNDLTADINLLKPLTTPRFTLGISAGALRKRTNQRTFTITDTFGYLVARLNRKNRYGERYCDGKIVRENYVYPIAGRIGVDKTVTTFLELTVFGSLGGEEGKGPPTMADMLTFTTAISVSASPKIEFTPVTNNFQLANAALTASADRNDKHEVTIGLAIAGGGLGELDSFRSFAFSPGRGGGRTAAGRPGGSELFQGERVTGGRTPSERLAVLAVDQLKRSQIQLIHRHNRRSKPMAKEASKSKKPAASATPKKAPKKTAKKTAKKAAKKSRKKIFDPLGPGYTVSSKSGG
jgi:hypothetical protein